jgi:hypothetical protein
MGRSDRTYPPPPDHEGGWFRVPHSDAGLGGGLDALYLVVEETR